MGRTLRDLHKLDLRRAKPQFLHPQPGFGRIGDDRGASHVANFKVLAHVRVDRPSGRALKQAPEPDTEAEVAQRQEKLEQDILSARDATQQRLADAVAALETVRLGLLRMQAGSATVESLTGDLAAAREVAADADRLLQAQQDVEQLLIVKDD